MAQDRPTDLNEYVRWLAKEHHARLDKRSRNHYNLVASQVKSSFGASPEWTQLLANLTTFDEKYLLATGTHRLLTASSVKPELVTKPFRSFVLKTFRRNVLENKNWPEEPNGGWLLPSNWYGRINDICRTFVVVRYLDGVRFLADEITAIAKGQGGACTVSLEAREWGYYAAHVTFVHRTEIPGFDWDTETIDAHVELQITTQLQDVLRTLTHKYYEERRERPAPPETQWQWEYESEEFAANYLGHILHYVEGMIMELRSRQDSTADSTKQR